LALQTCQALHRSGRGDDYPQHKPPRKSLMGDTTIVERHIHNRSLILPRTFPSSSPMRQVTGRTRPRTISTADAPAIRFIVEVAAQPHRIDRDRRVEGRLEWMTGPAGSIRLPV
jgi:hypothetical protein